MINLDKEFNDYFSKIDEIHNNVSQLNCKSLIQEVAEEWEKEIKTIQQKFLNFLQNNFSEESFAEQPKPILEKTTQCLENLTHDLESMQLTLLFKGRGINCPIQSYMEKYPLANRVLILGCGHNPQHHTHDGAYCLDTNAKIMPDAKIDITSSLMNYLPNGSFSKVILEELPTDIFDNNKWQNTFNQLHRILAENGIIEFNSMFGTFRDGDSNNMFNLAITEADLKSISGKKMKDCPELSLKYNNRLKSCFGSVEFYFSNDFDMNSIPQNYTVYKIKPEKEETCILF